jgi:hypothetical protein
VIPVCIALAGLGAGLAGYYGGLGGALGAVLVVASMGLVAVLPHKPNHDDEEEIGHE